MTERSVGPRRSIASTPAEVQLRQRTSGVRAVSKPRLKLGDCRFFSSPWFVGRQLITFSPGR